MAPISPSDRDKLLLRNCKEIRVTHLNFCNVTAAHVVLASTPVASFTHLLQGSAPSLQDDEV